MYCVMCFFLYRRLRLEFFGMDLKTQKSIARDQLAYAVRIGRIKKPDRCELCGYSADLQGHHECYSRPLKVIWCCKRCHSKLDGPKRKGKKYRCRRSKGSQSPYDTGPTSSKRQSLARLGLLFLDGPDSVNGCTCANDGKS